MRNLLTTVFLLLGLVLAAQGETILTRYTMAVSFADVTSLTSTTHRATLNAQSDQLGEGYLANQIQVGYRVLTSTKRHFEVTTIENASFGSATVVLTEIGATTLGPNGSGVLYDPGAYGMIPPLPANATGVSQALLANMLIHNFEVAQTLAGGATTVVTSGDITGDGSSGSPVSYVRPIPTWAELAGKPTVFPSNHEWNAITGKPTTFPSGDDDPNNERNRLGGTGSTVILYEADGTTEVDRYTVPFAGYSARTNPELDLTSVTTFSLGIGSLSTTWSGDKISGYRVTSSKWLPKIIIDGTSANSNASGEFVLTVDSGGATIWQHSYQLYDLTNNQKVDEHLTGNVMKIVVDNLAGEVTYSIPNIAGNYPNGFRLILN